ncbi:MAG: glycosyltransferase, partial [Actinomycetota bacterium]|nr:glycosyltransferase [Actinomycetota bacterium]
MRLTIVIGSLDVGGSERQVIELVRAATRQQVACSIVCLSHEGPLADEARAAGISVVAIGLNRPWKLWRIWALARALRATRPDAVYGLLFWGYGLGLPTAAVATPRAVRVAGRRG